MNFLSHTIVTSSLLIKAQRMTLSALRGSTLLPVILIVIAMLSIQSGAALAKNLFPLIGAPGVTALRLGLGALILCIVFKP
ncbi:hypothetical protein [Symbiopectobacterium sp.]|uniref:hypothetical protein n=1 Tax=Symbiopectobacterium sp. TaxID=2952789 RepID=UPI003F682C04